MCDKKTSLINIISYLIESSSDSEDENIIDYLYFLKKDNTLPCEIPTQRIARDHLKLYIDNIPSYTNAEFKKNFRISISLYKELCEQFEQSEVYNSLRSDKRLPARTYIAVFLWFSGSSRCTFRILGQRFKLSTSTISRIMEKTSVFISSLSPDIIKWPNERSKQRCSRMLAIKCGFPKAIGCIGSTQIAIDTPYVGKDDYLNVNNKYSICLQAVCDDRKKFTDIFVGYPGSSHESMVFKNSPLYENLASCCSEYYILGNTIYPCSEHLITPYTDSGNLSDVQKYFNTRLYEGLKTIKQAFGMLKQRFKQLNCCRLRGIDKICNFITACCVLHNISDEWDHIFTQDCSAEDNFYSESHEESYEFDYIRDVILKEMQITENMKI